MVPTAGRIPRSCAVAVDSSGHRHGGNDDSARSGDDSATDDSATDDSAADEGSDDQAADQAADRATPSSHGRVDPAPTGDQLHRPGHVVDQDGNH